MVTEFTLLPEDADKNELWIAQLAPRPQDLAATGLDSHFLADLIVKHVHVTGTVTLRELAKRTALNGAIVEDAVTQLRKELCLEVRTLPAGSTESGVAYTLTERGRGIAQNAFAASGYVGPAPIPVEAYREVMRAQSIRLRNISRERMESGFADTVIDPELLERLGPAVNSGKAIFLYGHAGTGKTYVAKRLANLFNDPCLIPHAVLIGQSVLRIYDASTHKPLGESANSALLQRGHDQRYVMCSRPVVMAGGELSADMLEVQYDRATRQYRAPLQLKANGGLLLLDDLGRQRVDPALVLNRWIVPMEDAVDYLTLGNGEHFQVPFDLLLVFSSNLPPQSLADEAFLRRIGYKIRFSALKPAQYHAIWRDVCEQNGVEYDANLCEFAIRHLHVPNKVPLLPCHPADLVDMAIERMEYMEGTAELDEATLRWAWKNYFVGDGDGL